MRRYALGATLALTLVVPGVETGSAAAATAPTPLPGGSADVETARAQARASQWYLDSMGITKAQQVTRGEGVKVCIVDSVVNRAAPALQGVHWGEETSVQSPDREIHGTSMATLIAGNGRFGTQGVAPGVTLMTSAVATARDGDALTDPNALLRSMAWCADHGAKVLNLSLVSGGTAKAIAYAQARDVVVVAGTGNLPGSKIYSDMAGSFGVLSVAGTDSSRSGDRGSTRSGYQRSDPKEGPTDGDLQGVSVLGPSSDGGWKVEGATAVGCEGIQIALAEDQTSFQNSCGTSDATAVISGVVALVRAAHPELNAANVVNRIVRTAKRPVGGKATEKLPDPYYGFGIVDAYAAVTAKVPVVSENPLGSQYTGGRGVWDPAVVPQRAEPAVGTTLPPGDPMAMQMIDPMTATTRPTPMSTGTVTPTAAPSTSSAATSPAAATSAAVAADSTSGEGGVPGWVWPVAGLSLLVAVASGIVISRRRT